MKIFLVGTEFVRGTGGIQYVNRLLLRALLEMAHATPSAIEVFSYSDSEETFRLDFPTGGAALHAFDRSRTVMAAGLARRLASIQPHLVLFTHVRLLRLARLVRLLAPGARVAVLSHGVEVWEPLPRSLRREMIAADAVVAPSEFTRRKLIEVNGIPAEKTSVVAHGLDPDFTEVSPAGDGPRDANLVLAVARLNRADLYKGIEVAIAAMPRVVSRCPQARLLIAGDGDDRARLEKMAEELNVSGCVDFLGEVSGARLRDLYQRAAVFVMPSQKEGFGIVFLEAMHHGVPVVAARAGATEEVVLDGVTGILVPPNDPVALGSAVSGLLLLADERNAMGAAARCRVAEGFLFADFVARWQRWIAEVCPAPLHLARQGAVCGKAAPVKVS